MPAKLLYCGEKNPDQGGRHQALSKEELYIPVEPRIVIIEDEFFVAWNLQTILRDLNFGLCEIASDAKSGVDLAINQEADLLLVDVNLGGGPDGIEAVRRILEYRKVEVVFITAYIDEANLSRIRLVAPDAFVLSKPVSQESLLSAINKLFPQS